MNVFQTVILIALAGNTALGLFVLFANPRRVLNLCFTVLSSLIALWLSSMFFASLQQSELPLLFWVRQTSAAAGVLPAGFFLVYLAVTHPGTGILRALYKLRYLLLACLAVVILCHSPVFILSATVSNELQTVPVSQYGSGFILYVLFFFAVITVMTAGFLKGLRQSTGVQKEELQFLQLGGSASLLFGISLLGISVVLNNQELGRFVPLSVLVLDGFVAYGIATRRILAASVVLQRAVSYILMVVYLTALYMAVQWLAGSLFALLMADPSDPAHLVATLAVAFSLSPAYGWMQLFARYLFPYAAPVNVDEILKRAGHIFREVSTEGTLVASFATLIKENFGTTRLILLRPNADGDYCRPPPSGGVQSGVFISKESPLVQLLKQEHDVFTADMLQRMRPSPLVDGARRELEALGAAAFLGSFMRKEMKAVILLFPKKSGRIYDRQDQRALQLLCDQFAVALENANLYTAVQDGKIYNEILLDSLTSGIIAVSANRDVTVFNQRAQKLTGLSEASVVGRPMSGLPPVLAECLQSVIMTQTGFRDKELRLVRGADEIPVRVSGAVFRSHTGDLLGALLAFNDMTVLKKMEEQIRRTDRLSSIGTLSAGMAHEIKNPLVTIKTFTQLLPRQYNDADFRNTFFELVGQEVTRIDTIVNRLLNFARPAKASLKPVSLHEVLENSMRLVGQQLAQREIILERHLDAKRCIIEADSEQLNQTFINLFLNAIQAIHKNGTLTVRTSVVKHSQDIPLVSGVRSCDCIQVDIQDTGCGVSPEHLRKIFDPFFTTKENGVGLGLSVSHGIIQEHRGTIDVESEEGRGTVFHLQFPLLNQQEKTDP